MSSIRNKIPRLAVRDSFDDDDLSDIDDEVFIRDGKNGILKIDDECGVKRPLMAPRRKFKSVHMTGRVSLPYRALLAPFCYGLIALFILLGLIVLCALTANLFPMPLTVLRKWLSNNDVKSHVNKTEAIPCTSLDSKIVWTKSLPKFTSEAPLRSSDVNGDSVEDIIVGYSTGLDAMDAPDSFCTLYFENQKPCLGGVLALDGRTGEIIWTHWTGHAILSVDCSLDLNIDSTKDCIISGRGGILHALNGRDGNSIWEIPRKEKELPTSERPNSFDIYDAKFIPDIDDDEIGDVVASHILQVDEKRLSEVVIISGKTGKIIRNAALPETEELFVAPQVLVHPDGENIFVVVTNSQKQSGGLYVVTQSKLMHGELKLQKLHHGAGNSPILVDVTLDGTEDIVAAIFNSTIVAYDGRSFQQIWNYTVPNSEVISIPIPGYFNDDNVPDFMVKHQMGPEFPVYYYTVATVLNGKTGKPILEEPMEDSMSAQMSGLSLSVQGFGNDWFLHWSADCLKYEGSKEKYRFLEDQNIKSIARADLCKLRFNSTLTSSLYAFSQHVGPPGLPLYFSEDWKKLEFNNSFDPLQAAENYFERHPLDDSLIENEDVAERSPKPRKGAELEKKFDFDDDFFRERNDKYDLEDYKDEVPAIIDFEDKVPDGMNFADELKGFSKWEDLRPKKVYDVLYDEGNERLDLPQSEVRAQRSDKIPKVKNDTNDVQNKLDPSMDYTNGQTKRYYSLEPVNRSNSIDDDSDYFSMSEDVDFTDDPEEISDTKRKRETRQTKKTSSKKTLGEKEIPVVLQNGNGSTIKLVKKSKEKIPRKKSLKKKKKKVVLNNEKEGQKELFRTKRIRKRSPKVRNIVTGVQRQPPTGILLPSLKVSEKRSIDLLFSTYWLPTTETPIVLLQQDLDCIRRKEENLGKKISLTAGDFNVKECLIERGFNFKFFEEAIDRENVKMALGQMTIYRMQLQCVCPEDMPPGKNCKDISARQSWSAYLGSTGNGYFKPLRPKNS